MVKIQEWRSVVNKKKIPFYAIGPDHALEQTDEIDCRPCWHNTDPSRRCTVDRNEITRDSEAEKKRHHEL